jgi:hypothetical protein
MTPHRARPSFLVSFAAPLAFSVAVGCGGSAAGPPNAASSGAGVGTSGSSGSQAAPLTGQSDFQSAAPPGGTVGGVGGATLAAGAPTANGAAMSSASSPSTSTTRTVEETDLYALDGNTLYYLSGYRGLMAFDLTQVDQPKFLGRYAIFGTPVQMIVQNGLAVVVVADWYGKTSTGAPFHGSIVQGLDVSDPTNIKLVGQAPLGGWVQDTRVVGNVLYAVSEDYGWQYGWGVATPGVAVSGGPVGIGGPSASDVIVSSVSFANGTIQQVSSKTYAGYGGIFNVTPNSIMLAHQAASAAPNLPAPSKTDLEYLDISDPGGAIAERGKIEVDGSVEGWGADNGRWSLDFADGLTAHVIGCSDGSDCTSGYILSTVDFSNPDQPKLDSELAVASGGWLPVARFDSGRMYLSPTNYSPVGGTTPLQIFDLSNPSAPVLAGTSQIPGSVWLMIPSGAQLFALGQDDSINAEQVSLKYLDVTNAAAPALIGTSSFGEGWTSTPATDTFKAFTHDPTQGLVVLPFSGWDYNSGKYDNGVQLIQFTPSSIATAGAAHTTGWVERGIFANGRIVSLSDLALSVVDYSDPLSPTTTAQLTLARNIVASQPGGATIAEVSSDWWGNDVTHSDVRVLPTADAAETKDESTAPDASVPGIGARVFVNGERLYAVTSVQIPTPCGSPGGLYNGPAVPAGSGPQQCYAWQEQVQVVDTSNGGAKARGTVALPVDPSGWSWNWGWYGFFYYDWYDGGEIVQVGADALAFRRWHPNYAPNGQYVDASTDLYIVDLSNPDAPSVSSMVVTNDQNAWWGDMTVIGNTLYTTHYEWVGGYQPGSNGSVRYYLDQIDLSDRAHPSIGAKINVPGILVGGSSDGSLLYTIDYRWVNDSTQNDFDVLRLQGAKAYLQSKTTLDGWVGSFYFSADGKTAYTTTQRYSYTSGQPSNDLHQIDLSDPTHPNDQIASGPNGWGWLLGVQGDRMLVQTGWGDGNGMDVYKLAPGAAPSYDQFVRTQGWSINAITRQTTNTSDELFLSSGDWGVQVVDLK